MSPASSGSLEVERYIGACLISSHSRNQKNSPPSAPNSGAGKGCANRDAYYPREPFVHDVYSGGYVAYRPRRCNSVDGWAGGMPLISFANHQRRNRRPDVADAARCASPHVADDVPHSPLSRLAVHTQGLPLILSSRHGNRRTKAATRNGLPQGRGVVDSAAKKIGECKDNHVNGVDALSVASDESSGSANSEVSLPRIIKPRKRRKKDRKPHPGRNSQIPGDSQLEIVSPINKPYVPYCYERFTNERIQPPRNNNHDVYGSVSFVRNGVGSENSIGEGRYIPNDLSSETPQLHHRFEDVVGGLDDPDADDNVEPSSCQCRYCDPAGQIWDVDRHCYSPFLTTPIFQTQLSTESSSSDSSSLDMSYLSTRKHHLSERMSSAMQNQCLISSFVASVDEEVSVKPDVCRPSRTQQCLEISTKIVTSPNGHRDLEIRLFSSSPVTIGDKHASKVPAAKTSDKCNNSKLCLETDESDQSLSPEE